MTQTSRCAKRTAVSGPVSGAEPASSVRARSGRTDQSDVGAVRESVADFVPVAARGGKGVPLAWPVGPSGRA